MTTKELRREKRLRLIVEAMERWREKLKKATKTQGRALRALDKLERARVRAQRMMKAETQVAVAPLPANFFAASSSTSYPVLDDIPAFLERDKRDKAIATQLESEINDKKREKARVRIEHMKAKRSGETRKMPLTGRAALDALK